jgi:glucokinase-like ROK family protein
MNMTTPRTGNRQLMQELNTSLVLNLIRETECTSQVEIQNKTSLSAGTISRITKELKQKGFIETVGPGSSTSGRKPVMMRFNPKAGYVISAALFSDTVNIAILDLAGNIKNRLDFPTEPENGPSSVFSRFAREAENLIQKSGIKKAKILGVGIAFEGSIDADKGQLIYSASFDWRDVDIRGLIEEILEIPVYVISEGASMALGEYRCGAGRDCEDIVCVDIDAGIGSVALMSGQIRYGHRNMAGEIGHTLMVEDGEICRCGKTGCLETVAAGWGILAKIRKDTENGTKSNISNQVHSESTRVAVRAIFEAAKDGDKLAGKVVDEAAKYLGKAISWVINYSDPELVILSGCITDEGGKMLLDLVKHYTGIHVVDGNLNPVKMESGELGELAVIIGAATLVYEKVFKLPIG